MWSDAVLAVAVSALVRCFIRVAYAVGTDTSQASDHRLCLDGKRFDNKAVVRRMLVISVECAAQFHST